jgi:hypothetical protein
VSKTIADEVVGANFADAGAFKTWSSNGSRGVPQARRGVESRGNRGRRSLRLSAVVNSQLARWLDGRLRQRPMRGYEVWGERRLGRRWKFYGDLTYISWWSEWVIYLLQCGFMRLLALWVETLQRKWSGPLAEGTEGGQATFVMRGRSRWKRWRIRESGFELDSNRFPREVCNVNGGRSLWIRKPRVALQMAEVIVITKLGAAHVRGQRIPRPPWHRLMWLIRVE